MQVSVYIYSQNISSIQSYNYGITLHVIDFTFIILNEIFMKILLLSPLFFKIQIAITVHIIGIRQFHYVFDLSRETGSC